MTSVPPEAGYSIEPFEWHLPCCLNLMLLASPWLVIYGFSNCSFCYIEHFKVDSHFSDIEQFKIDSYLLILSKSRLTLLVCFYWLWAGKLLYWVCTRPYPAKNNLNPLRLKKKSRIQEPRIASDISHVQWFINWLGSPVNK